MIGDGATLFSRFAFPPNHLGYCGPANAGLLPELIVAGEEGLEEMRHVIPDFDGAWPYLELIAACAGRNPLDPEVVEAYWLGSPLLERTDLLLLGNSIEERFRRRAGINWDAVSHGLSSGARPNHSFHVFCIYPWVGLLKSGMVDPALQVLDRCRIRWGVVEGSADSKVLVRSRSLHWDGRSLGLGAEGVEAVSPAIDGSPLEPEDLVAMHWDYVCQRITRGQLKQLEHYHKLHLGIVNGSASRLESSF
jgi:Family of unknown function (DUF6390)